jgi:hypothetical protein
MMTTNGSDGPQRYPFIPLRKALERARQLWEKASDHPVISTDAAQIWGYSPKASGGIQTVAALRYYGLIRSTSVGHARRLRFTDEAKSYFLDERPEKHAEAHKGFALKPKAMMVLWGMWKDRPPAQSIARSALKVDVGYSENSARELLAIYVDNLAFAKLTSSDRITAADAGDEEINSEGSDWGNSTSLDSTQSKDNHMPEVSVATPKAASYATAVPSGIRQDTCNLPEGVVVLSFPETFSAASYLDLEAWLEFQKNRLRRWVQPVET